MIVNTVKLMIGTNMTKGSELLKGVFQDLSWWSDNLETLAHYYDGCAIEITVKLDPTLEVEYVHCSGDIKWLTDHLPEYTYGFVEVVYPAGAIWYSFSKDYLEKNIVEIKEIFPDLSGFNEE